MKNESVATVTREVKIPKAEAIEKIAKHMAAVRVQLAAAKGQLATAVSPDKYRLHFQVNSLKKQANFCKAQIARLKKIPATEVVLSDEFGA
jgi:hypothetical protein